MLEFRIDAHTIIPQPTYNLKDISLLKFNRESLDFYFLPYAACFANYIFSVYSASVMLQKAEWGLYVF